MAASVGAILPVVTVMLNLLLELLARHHVTLLNLLFDVLQRLPAVRKLPGIYEVLEYQAELELKDSKGHTAIYRKRQRVRFLQDNIIAYQDTAWGDGEIFADYRCSPGVEVDRYREGNHFNILISLRETKHRDDLETLEIERTIHNGFVTDVEYFQVDIIHRTRLLSCGVVFPKSRLPKRVSVIAENSKRSVELGPEARQVLPDRRVRYEWQSASPKLFESYLLRWEW